MLRGPRWSKKTDELVRYVAGRCRPSLQSELGHWLEDSARFRAFITGHQDKVHKKLSSDNEENRLDVRSELLVAYLMLADRRFELAFEAYGAGQRGPDLTVTYRVNQRFNLEVTRLRATGDAADTRLANVIAAKLRQLPGDLPNGLVITTRGRSLSEQDLIAATRSLKMHADQKDDAFFARRGFLSARDFHAQFLHIGGVFVLEEGGAPPAVVPCENREARHPLSRDAVAALSACLAGTPRG